MPTEYAIEMKGITKTFGSVVANRDVELNVRQGEILALLGENGSGKTTALNVMAAALGLERDSPYNQSNFFPDYVEMCEYELTRGRLPEASRAITIAVVFDYMLDLRALNQGIDETREERFQEYLDAKYANFQMRTLDGACCPRPAGGGQAGSGAGQRYHQSGGNQGNG